MPPPVLWKYCGLMQNLNKFTVVKKSFPVIHTISIRQGSYSKAPPASTYPVYIKVDERTGLMEERKESIGMQRYREMADDYANMIEKEELMFERGRRHLANMMGEDIETFNQKKIDEAIAYLFPSGLYDKKARPVMKPPKELFSSIKAAQFDSSGRPTSYLFYTGECGLYEKLHEGAGLLKQLDDERDQRIENYMPFTEEDTLKVTPFFLPKDKVEAEIGQKIADEKFQLLITLLNRLKDHPLSAKAQNFLSQFEMEHKAEVEENVCKIEKLEDGRQKITSPDCYRKTARGNVVTYYPGNGNITVNGQDITYFPRITAREQILYPMLIARMLGKVDVEANLTGGGEMAQAVAMRYGIAHCLIPLVDPDTQAVIRAAGLLHSDPRRRERKKPGQEGARRKYTWLKR